jgi:hypothetical protein
VAVEWRAGQFMAKLKNLHIFLDQQ